jgi:hypothetical protein
VFDVNTAPFRGPVTIASVIRATAVLLVALLLAGCETSPAAPPTSPLTAMFPASGGFAALPVKLVDPEGLVRALSVADAGDAPSQGLVASSADPALLRLAWTGGMCDRQATLTIDRPAGWRFILLTEAGDPCLLAATTRALVLRTAVPIDPATVELAVDVRAVDR